VKDPEVKRPYIADDLEVLTTQTNLRGYHYELKFKTALGESSHRMTRHQDLVNFRLNGTGEYGGSGKIPLSFNTENGTNKALLKDAAIATGAFPVGLSPRLVERDSRYVLENPFLSKGANKMLLQAGSSYACVNVDGGVINNEPFGLTDQLLLERKKEALIKEGKAVEARNYELKKSAASFDSTLIMIDPFPSEETLEEVTEPLDAIKFAVPNLLNAMRQQLMYKEEELKNAYDEDNYTRFMVLPVRYQDDEKQKYPLACGGLGGFAGFFKKGFREHDFLLGRRNCQLFLQKYFSVPEEKNNPILRFGYEGVNQFKIPAKDGQGFFLPIIPDLRVIENTDGTAKIVSNVPEETSIDYRSVKINLSELLALQDKMEDRFDAVLRNLMNGERKNVEEIIPSKVLSRIRKKSKLKKFGTKVFSKVGMNLAVWQGKKIISTMFIDSVIKEMETRELLEVDA
jgi:hypothetical protein